MFDVWGYGSSRRGKAHGRVHVAASTSSRGHRRRASPRPRVDAVFKSGRLGFVSGAGACSIKDGQSSFTISTYWILRPVYEDKGLASLCTAATQLDTLRLFLTVPAPRRSCRAKKVSSHCVARLSPNGYVVAFPSPSHKAPRHPADSASNSLQVRRCPVVVLYGQPVRSRRAPFKPVSTV